MTSPSRRDVPAGNLPSFPEFKRHVWMFRDADDTTPIRPPPVMFSLVFDHEGDELTLVETVLNGIRRMDGFAHRAGISRWKDGRADASFADLEVLYHFLLSLASVGRENRVAREIAEFAVFTLGYRWV